MTTSDDRLKALFAADLPPARDPAFQANVLAALVRRRFLGELGLISAASALGAVALGVLWPTLGPVLARLGRDLAPAAIALAVAVSILALASGRSGGLTA
jgi:hypothetical protein